MSRPQKKSSCLFPLYDNISDWDVHRMLQWLRQNGLHSSIDTFAEEKIDGGVLLAMSEAELNSKRRISEKDKKKLVKALAHLPNSQISRQPGIMTRIRGQLKKKIGRDDVGIPPPVPQADYYTVMDESTTGGAGWGSDEFESSDEYEEPPENETEEFQGRSDKVRKFQNLRQQFEAAGFTIGTQPQEMRRAELPYQHDEIYDAPEPDFSYPHSGPSLEDDLYVPPQSLDEFKGGVEVYEVPDTESRPIVGKRPPPRIPVPRQTGIQAVIKPGMDGFPNKPVSPTEPPPDDFFGYGQDDIYDVPPEDGLEEQTSSPPPPPLIVKPDLSSRFGTSLSKPVPHRSINMSGQIANRKDPIQIPIRPKQPHSPSNRINRAGLSPMEPELPDRSSKPALPGHSSRKLPAGGKPPLPSKEDSFSDDDDDYHHDNDGDKISDNRPTKSSLPAPNSQPSLSSHLQDLQLRGVGEPRPPLPGREFKPTMPSRDTKPPMPMRETKPLLPTRDPKPAIPARDSKPTLPDRDEMASGRESKPPLPEPSSKPQLPSRDAPPLPTASKPLLPARDIQPTIQDTFAAIPEVDTRTHVFESHEEELSSKEPTTFGMRQSKPGISPRPMKKKSPFEERPPVPVSVKPAVFPAGSIALPSQKPQMRPFPCIREKKLENCNWFHGDIDRKTCELALKRNHQDGSFLVRNSKNYPGEFSISLFYKGDIKHLRIRRRPDGKFAVGEEKAVEKAFTNVIDLIEHHRKDPLSLKTGGLAKLTDGCPL